MFMTIFIVELKQDEEEEEKTNMWPFISKQKESNWKWDQKQKNGFSKNSLYDLSVFQVVLFQS